MTEALGYEGPPDTPVNARHLDVNEVLGSQGPPDTGERLKPGWMKHLELTVDHTHCWNLDEKKMDEEAQNFDETQLDDGTQHKT
jgi:hypothetical protein